MRGEKKKSMKKKGNSEPRRKEDHSDSDFSEENSPIIKGPQLEREDTFISDHNIVFTPPEDLIAKSVFINEPIKTGAPINFV